MRIDKKVLERVAEVSRLDLTEEEKEKFLPQLEGALEAFSTLSGVDTKGVEPSFHPIQTRKALREDSPKESLTQKEALSLTEHKKDGYFKGPKAV